MKLYLNKRGSYSLDRDYVTTHVEPPSVEFVGRTKEDLKRVPFIWKTNEGALEEIGDMDSNHIFNVIRMLHNNTVVPAFRVLCPDTLSFVRHNDIQDWDTEYVSGVINLMLKELEARGLDMVWGIDMQELDTSTRNQLEDIKRNREYLNL